MKMKCFLYLQSFTLIIDVKFHFQSTKFRTKNWVGINDDTHGAYNKDSQIKFKTSMPKSGLCDYSNAYILVKCIYTCHSYILAPAESDNVGKEAVFKNCSIYWFHKWNKQDYIQDGVPQGSILGPTPFLRNINDLPDDGICNIAIYADDTTFYSKFDQASDLWQQVE